MFDSRNIIYGMDARSRYIPRLKLMIQPYSNFINDIKDDIYLSISILSANFRRAQNPLWHGRAPSVYDTLKVDDSITFKLYQWDQLCLYARHYI